jgi:hypothetical protein
VDLHDMISQFYALFSPILLLNQGENNIGNGEDYWFYNSTALLLATYSPFGHVSKEWQKKGVRTKYVVISCAGNKLNVKDYFANESDAGQTY